MDNKKTYSQAGQDLWVLSLFPEGFKGFFMDLGCGDPIDINNTKLLEENGWEGIAVDISDFSNKWKGRKARFIQMNALDVKDIFKEPILIDYLSIDVDSMGMNYLVLKNLIGAGFSFKALTIEHNIYQGFVFDKAERVPQRKLLFSKGYELVKVDVANLGNIYEDWWIKKELIDKIND